MSNLRKEWIASRFIELSALSSAEQRTRLATLREESDPDSIRCLEDLLKANDEGTITPGRSTKRGDILELLDRPVMRMHEALSFGGMLHIGPFEEGDLVNNRYRIERILGWGGMGTVYLASDTRFHERVALKVLLEDLRGDPEMLRRFEKEVHLARKITHHNVCRIHEMQDVPATGDRPPVSFFTMEFLEGETLSERLKRGTLNIPDELPLLVQFADGLAAAHRMGILHRDIKPGNMIICADSVGPRAVITDFGLVRLIPESKVNLSTDLRTTRDDGIGTPFYLAPEIAENESPTMASDVYALGLVFHKSLTGKLPFEDLNVVGMHQKRSKEVPPSLREARPEIPPLWDMAIRKALHPNPASRYPDAVSLLDDLRKDPNDAMSVELDTVVLVSAAGDSAHPTASRTAADRPTVPSPQRPRKLGQTPQRISRRVLVPAVGLGMAAAAGGGVWWSFSRSAGAEPFIPGERLLLSDVEAPPNASKIAIAAKRLLAVVIEQSASLTLVADSQIGSTLRLMKEPPNEPLVKLTARNVAVRLGLPAFVALRIEQRAAGWLLMAEIVRANDGAPEVSFSEFIPEETDIFHAVEAIGSKLCLHYGDLRIRASLPELSEVTTPSIEALVDLSNAERLYETGKVDEALFLLHRAAEVDPSFAIAYEKLGLVLISVGKRNAAAPYVDKAFALRAKTTRREQLQIEALYYQQRRDIHGTCQAYRELVTLFPKSAIFHRHVANAYSYLCEPDKQLQGARRCFELDPSSALNANLLGIALVEANQPDAALAHAAAWRKSGAGSPLFWTEGLAKMHLHDLADARATFENTAKIEDRRSFAHQYLSKIEILEGRVTDARDSMKAFLDRDFLRGETLYGLRRLLWVAELEIVLGNSAAAAAHIADLIDRANNIEFAEFLAYAGILASRMRGRQFLSIAKTRLEALQRSFPSQFLQSFCHLLAAESASSSDDATSAYESAVALLPDPHTLFAAGRHSLSHGHDAKALAYFTRLIDLKGNILRWHSCVQWIAAHKLATVAATRMGNLELSRDLARRHERYTTPNPTWSADPIS